MKNVRLLLSVLALFSMGSSVSLAGFQNGVRGKPGAAANLGMAEALLIYKVFGAVLDGVYNQSLLSLLTGNGDEGADPDAAMEVVEAGDAAQDVPVDDEIATFMAAFLEALDAPSEDAEVGKLLPPEALNHIGLFWGLPDLRNLSEVGGYFEGAFQLQRERRALYLQEELQRIEGLARSREYQSQVEAIKSIQSLLTNNRARLGDVIHLFAILAENKPLYPFVGEDLIRMIGALLSTGEHTAEGQDGQLRQLLRNLVCHESFFLWLPVIEVLSKNNPTEDDWKLIIETLQVFVQKRGYLVARGHEMLETFKSLLALPGIPQRWRDDVLALLRILAGGDAHYVALGAIEVLASHNPTEEDWKLIMVVLRRLLDEGKEFTCKRMAEVLGRLLSSQSSHPEGRWGELWSLLRELAEDEHIGLAVDRAMREILASPCIQPAYAVEIFTILFGLIVRWEIENISLYATEEEAGNVKKEKSE